MSKKYTIEKSIGFIIYRTALAMRSNLQRTLKDGGFNITPEQYGILNLLGEEEGLSQQDIGNILFKDKPNVSRMLDALERKKLISRQATDRRKYSIYLTEDGKALMEKILPIVAQLRKKTTTGLLVREIEALESILEKIYRNIS
jgi:DNA-binding MarR family transcriptional regulator